MLNPEIEDYLTPEQKKKYREALKMYKKRKIIMKNARVDAKQMRAWMEKSGLYH